MLASYAGHADLASSLLGRGADPNRLNDRGQSMLAGAIFKAHDDVVRVLTEGGADIHLGTPSAVETAKMFRRTEILKVLGISEGDGHRSES
jgi:ankyrin repeat protein